MQTASFSLGDFKLQSEEILTNAFLSYETHGDLNRDKSNVIIYPTWYSGNHEDIRAAIAPGRALDPDKYFIIVPDMFGNGHSSSPSNTEPPNDRGRFPTVTPYDNIIAQHKLVTENFDIEHSVFLEDRSLDLAKPNPDSLIESISGIDSKCVLYVGDSMEDLKMVEKCKDKGLDVSFCGIYGSSDEPELKYELFRKNNASFIIESIQELPKALNLV